MAEQPEAAAAEQETQDPSLGESIDASIKEQLGKLGIGGLGGTEEDGAPTKQRRSTKASRDDEDDEDPDLDEDPDDDGQEKMPDEDTDLEDSANNDDEDAEDGDESDEDEEDEDMALHRAYTLLHDKAGIPAKVLKRTPRAELISWARSVEAARAEGAGESRGTDAEPDDSKGSAKADGSGPAQAAGSDWAAVRKGIADGIGIDEEAADALKPLFEQAQSLKAEVAELKSSNKDLLDQARAAQGKATIDINVRRLRANYPDLKTPDGEEALVQQAATLAAGLRAQGQTVDRTVFDKAARALWGSPKRADLPQLRRNGSSPVPGRNGAGGTALDDDGYWGSVARTAMSGSTNIKERISRLKPPPPKEARPRK